jgi:iron complex transport system substrate-binding protein
MRDKKMLVVLVVGLVLGGSTFVLMQGQKAASPSPSAPNAPLATTPQPDQGASRVIILSPALTEMVYAMNAQDRIVGVGEFCVYPPEVAELPSCGGIVNPSYEIMESLEPDLVIVQGVSDTIVRYCKAAGIPTLDVPLDSLEDVFAAAATIGEALDATESATALVGEMRTELDAIRAATATLAAPRVFVSVGRSPGKLKDILTAGGGSFLDDLLVIAGGENVFASSGSLWPTAALEAVVASEPEVIIDIQPNETIDDKAIERAVAEWGDLGDGVPAVRDRRIHVMGEDWLLLPGPRVVDTARTLAQCLHPEVRFDE